MRTHHFITTSTLVMVAMFAASCAKSPSKPTESSPAVVSADTNVAMESAQLPDPIIPAGSINIIGIEVSQFMSLYAAIADAQLDTSELGKLPSILIRFKNTNDVTRSEAVRLLDKVLYDQAGIVATHLDTKQVQFKYRSSGDEK